MGNSISMSIGLAPVSLASSRVLACDRLLLVRHLIGEMVARLQIGVDDAEPADDEKAEEAVEARPLHHARGDPAAEAAQRIDARVRAPDSRDESRLARGSRNTPSSGSTVRRRRGRSASR